MRSQLFMAPARKRMEGHNCLGRKASLAVANYLPWSPLSRQVLNMRFPVKFDPCESKRTINLVHRDTRHITLCRETHVVQRVVDVDHRAGAVVEEARLDARQRRAPRKVRAALLLPEP